MNEGLIVIIVVCVFLFGLMVGYETRELDFTTQAIKHKCMEYNKTNGELYWIKDNK